MRKRIPKRDYRCYTVDVHVGRSFRITVKAFDDGHAAMIVDRMLEETGTKGFTPAPETWIDIENSVPTPRGRPKKWLTPQWGYPWECLGAGRAALQASLNDLNQELKEVYDRQEAEAKTSPAKGKDAS